MRICIVDDHVGTLNSLRAYLVSMGHQVVVFSDPLKAVSILASATEPLPGIDLLVTDLNMPGMNGLELIRTVRKSRADLPAILMTAYGDNEVHKALKELSCCGYLDKPFSPEKIFEMVESFFK